MKLTKILSALGLFVMAAFISPAFAEEAASKGTSLYGPIGAALAIGLGVIGGALGQGKTAAAALEGMARNPDAKLLVPMIIGLALIESLVIYSLLIAFNLAG